MKMQVFDDAEDSAYFLELLDISTKRRKKLIKNKAFTPPLVNTKLQN